MAKAITYIGLDVHKDTIAVALAEAGRRGEVREYGRIANTAPALKSLVSKLTRNEHELRFCYEAGPCGYGIQRQLSTAGQDCVVVAPSLIPRKPGERIKTDRRDAIKLARSHRAGELTPVWVPDQAHEAMRDLVRARTAAVRALRQARQQLSSFLLRQGHHYQRTPWTQPHRRWLAGLTFTQAVHHIVLEDLIATVEAATARRDRLEQHIEAALPEWTLAPVVHALQSLRGLRLVGAAVLVAELGDITRFDNPPSSWRILGWCRPRPPAAAAPAGRDYQSGQRCRAANADRGCVDISLPGPDQPRAAVATRRSCQTHSRHSVESARAAVSALSQVDPSRQADQRCHSSDRPRTGRLRLGDRTRGTAERRLIVPEV